MSCRVSCVNSWRGSAASAVSVSADLTLWKLLEADEPLDEMEFDVDGDSTASQLIASGLESVPSIERSIEERRRGIWWQKLAISAEMRQELRLQMLTYHSIHPKCGACTKCRGYASSKTTVRCRVLSYDVVLRGVVRVVS